MAFWGCAGIHAHAILVVQAPPTNRKGTKMTGQIPKYGDHFRRESLPYTYGLASRAYVLRANPDIFIRSDSTSERWGVYVGRIHGVAYIMGSPLPTMSKAMDRARALFYAAGGI